MFPDITIGQSHFGLLAAFNKYFWASVAEVVRVPARGNSPAQIGLLARGSVQLNPAMW